MRARKRWVGAASAAVVAGTLALGPTGAGTAVADPAPDGGQAADAAGPHAADRPQVAEPRDPSDVRKDRRAGGDELFVPGESEGFEQRDTVAPSGRAADKLGEADTKRLQQAQVEETETVTVMMLAADGDTDAVAAAVRDAGGAVGSVTDSLGYVRASVPTDAVPGLADLSVVRAIDLDRSFEVPVPTPDLEARAPRAARASGPEAPGAGTPVDNPYLPVHETGATDFVADHPEWDGRGTVVGVVDTGVDVGHPALQETSDGRPKIVDWITVTDPITDGDGTWVRMSTEVSGPSFSFGGDTWTSAEGDFLAAWFYERSTAASDFGGDLDGDGEQDRFGVLFQPSTGTTWVDTDRDRDFTDELAMQPYAVDRHVGHFGADDPATGTDEQIPFVVEHREGVDLSALGARYAGQTGTYVNIGLPVASHGTHVAGIVGGTSLLGGEMSGAAPGAQIVSARACTWGGACTQAALTEGMIDLVTERDVDVVNLSIGGLPALNDGSDVMSILYDEIIETHGVQIVIAAGNDGLGTNTVSSPSVASKAISVAASVSSDTWWADYGSRVATEESIFGFSSRGPAEDGALAPQVAAPGAAVSTIPMWLEGEAVPAAGYQLPAGYGMANGTSMAAPQVTGAAALLLSAAKAESVEVTPAALRTALTGTARLLPGVPTTAQGAGVVDTPAAWGQLSKGVQTHTLEVSAPVCSPFSDLLAEPGTGPGVYNRCLPGEGGQVTGEEQTYDVQVTRTSGTSGSVNHRIGWIGNDGTFTARAALPLKRGMAKSVTITASPSTSGAHSAIMTIDDPGTAGVDGFVAVTVLATEPPAANGFTVTDSGTLPRGGATSVLVPVPEGVEALQMTLGGLADGSQVRVLPIDPEGVPAETNASNVCFTGYPDPTGCDATTRAVTRPMAGVWEFVVEARHTSGTEDNTFTATVTALGMSFEPGSTTIPSMVVHTPEQVSTTGANEFAPVEAHVADGEVGLLKHLLGEVADGEQIMNRIDVPRGTSRLEMTIEPREEGSDVDMYFVNAVTGELVASSTGIGAGTEEIVLDDAPPGTHYVIAVGVRSEGGTTSFDYHEAVYTDGLGTIEPGSSATVDLATGDSIPVEASVSLATLRQTNQPIAGRVRVANEHGTTIGAADVRVTEVTMPQLEVEKWEVPFVGAAMNDAGQVGGDRQKDWLMTPTVWSAEDGFSDRELVGGTSGAVLDINASGESAGIYYTDEGGLDPVRWAADGTMTAIGLPGWRDYQAGFGTGIDDEGTMIGFVDQEVQEADGWQTYRDPFLHTVDGGFERLEHLSGNPAQTQPTAVVDGTAVGDSLTDEGWSHAVSWDLATGQITDLGTLEGQSSAAAKDVSATGTVVGVSGDDAFVWTAEDGMQRLTDYGFDAVAEEVTDDGWILGTVEVAPDFVVSAMWDPQGRIWDVSGMVPTAEDRPFLPVYSFGINDEHQLMVYGYGGEGPEPSSSTVQLRITDELLAWPTR